MLATSMRMAVLELKQCIITQLVCQAAAAAAAAVVAIACCCRSETMLLCVLMLVAKDETFTTAFSSLKPSLQLV
jgi:hypothetical protein